MNKDLTQGKPSKVLWLFCMPLFGSIIFQQLYNIADSFVAGRFINENALASVGNSYEITLIFIAFAFGCNIGCSVIVSELFGAKRYKDMKTSIYTAGIITLITCLVMMIIGFIFCKPLLCLIDTPSEIIEDSSLYLRIYISSLPFVFFYNLSEGIFTALGDSKTAFIFLASSSLANIGMDILFVAGFKMKVDGVAWATFICQGVSCILAVFFVLKRLSKFHVDGKPKLFDKEIFKKFLRIAIPSTLQQSFISFGNIAIQKVINGFGTAVIAGYSASVKLNNLVITSFTTIGNGMSNYTAQNMGANKPKRVKQGFFAGLKMVWLLSIPLALIYFFLGDKLMYLFMTSPSEDALKSGAIFLKILSPFYIVVSAKLVTDGILRGAKLMKFFIIATFTDLILRVLLAFIFSNTNLGSIGIWCSWPIGWVVSSVLSILFYFLFFVQKQNRLNGSMRHRI